jgi:hypothetical protein
MKGNTRERVGRAMSTMLSVMLILGLLTTTPMIASAQLTESFEGGWGDWYADMNYDPAYFNIDLSSLYAYDGTISVGIGSHGLPSPPVTGWVERVVPVPPNTLLNVDLSFQLYSEGTDSPREVLAYIGNSNPSDYPDFTLVGMTDQAADAWYEYTHANSFTTSPSGQIYVALGTFNSIIGFKTYWVDFIVIGGITIDNNPPDITNMQPTNQTIISDNQPLIAANYTDASGVSVPSVVLEVDATNVTTFSTVTDSDIAYTPSAPLSEGVHNVYLEATDTSSNQNTGVKTWWFTVDTMPPQITSEQPANQSTTGSTTPTISASFSDVTSGTDINSVQLVVDSIDVTAGATITPNSVSYVPLTPLADGPHDVYLEVGDNSNPQNLAAKAWSFTVDTVPPIITNLQPADGTRIGNSQPTISASYSDPSGIDTGSVVLEVDTFGVTMMSTVTGTDVTYVPSFPLTDGVHDVHVVVQDVNGNPSEELWQFTVDATPPVTTLNVLNPQYTDTGLKTFISSTTPLNLTWDDGTGTGVETVSFLYYAFGETEPGYSPYASDFTISISKADGLIYVKFKSTDELGNEETEQMEELYLDNTAPVTNIGIGSPSHTDAGTTYITSLTQITLTSDDGSGSGISETMYGIDDPSCPNTYAVPFVLDTVSEGSHTIYVKAEDNVENEETVSSINIYLDETPPDTSAVFGDPKHSDSGITYVNVGTEISFTPDDGGGSGTASTMYRVLKDGSPEIQWTQYTGTPFSLSGIDGLREVVFRSTDNLGNEEIDKTVQVYLDTTAPTSSVPGFDETGTNRLNNTLSSIVITADDGDGSGIGEIKYGIDDPNCPNSYSGPIVVGTMTEGSHTLHFKAVDNVENEEGIRTIVLVLDVTSPVADAGDDIDADEGDTVILDGSGSSDGASGSGVSEYTWTFVYEGSTITLDGASPSFKFNKDGTYLVTLTIKDNAGHESTDTVTVEVEAQAGADSFLWILLVLIVVVVSMLLLVALFKKKKKKPEDEEEEGKCENCGHVMGPHDRVCPECDSLVSAGVRR